MPDITITIDPDGAPLELTDENGYEVQSPLRVARGPVDRQWAGSIDTEGERSAGSRRGNTEIGMRILITGPTKDAFRGSLAALSKKVHKLQGEGGVLRIDLAGETIDWEVRGVNGAEWLLDNSFLDGSFSEDELTLICAPFGVGEEYHAGTFAFDADPERLLEFEVGDVPGDALAHARVRVTSPDDLWEVMWGRESRHLADGAPRLLYLADALTPLDGAGTATPTIQGTSVPVIRQGALTPNWRPVASTGYLEHHGIYGVYAWLHMPAGNTGAIDIKFEYGVGGLARRTENAPLRFAANHDREGELLRVSLGQVFVRPASQGIHRWVGQVAARSTVVGDDIDIHALGLVPLPEGNGSVSIEPTVATPSAVAIRDEFDQTAANLHGKTIAAVGHTAGPRTAGTFANDASVGTEAWLGPGPDPWGGSSWSSPNLAGAKSTQYLKATNCGFSIPSGTTIKGIIAEVKWGMAFASDTGGVGQTAVFPTKAGTIAGASRASAGARLPRYGTAWQSFGHSTDLWDTTWAYTDINNSGFGVALQVHGAGGILCLAFVESVRVTVIYETAAGETWATTGDSTDIAVETSGHTAQRTEVSDADFVTGRYAIAGAGVFADTVVTVAAKRSVQTVGSTQQLGQAVLARYVDTNNWLMGGYGVSDTGDFAFVAKRVLGAYELLGSVPVTAYTGWRTTWLHVDYLGRYWLWGLTTGVYPQLLLAGRDTSLLAGEALDDGKAGFYDVKTGASTVTRNYDNFAVWVPQRAGVLFGDRALELRSDGVERETVDGGIWEEMTPSGDYVTLSPAGVENRRNRFALLASPVDPDLMGVPVTPSDLTVDVYVRPRYHAIPEPS